MSKVKTHEYFGPKKFKIRNGILTFEITICAFCGKQVKNQGTRFYHFKNCDEAKANFDFGQNTCLACNENVFKSPLVHFRKHHPNLLNEKYLQNLKYKGIGKDRDYIEC